MTRLEEIKKKDVVWLRVRELRKDWDWLINRVGELERDLDVLRVKYRVTKEQREEFLYEDIPRLEEDNQRHKQALENLRKHAMTYSPEREEDGSIIEDHTMRLIYEETTQALEESE